MVDKQKISRLELLYRPESPAQTRALRSCSSPEAVMVSIPREQYRDKESYASSAGPWLWKLLLGQGGRSWRRRSLQVLAKGWTHGINFEVLKEQGLSFRALTGLVERAETSASVQPVKGSSLVVRGYCECKWYLAGPWWEHWTGAL
jgi:hypothetical protein